MQTGTPTEPAVITGDTIVSNGSQTEQLTPAQMHDLAVWMNAAKAARGAMCRKKGWKRHAKNPAGTKLARKLERQGSVYGRVSLVQEAIGNLTIQKNLAKMAQKSKQEGK